MINIDNKFFTGWTFIDLFAGIGGFRLALESLGAKCVYSNEWDSYAQKVYYDNYHDMPEGDITKVNESTIPDHDILCAGFPCQAFSISGKQSGFSDSRGTLFFDVARIVKEKNPKVVFMENVKNFATHDNGNTLTVVQNTLKSLDYSFYYKVLNSADFGVPQKRERIYMIGIRKDLDCNKFVFPNGISLKQSVKSILEPESLVPQKYYTTRTDIVITKNDDSVSFSNKPIRIGTVNKGGQGERIYSTHGVAITLSAYGGGTFSKTGGYYINGKIRKLTPRECARLMGFPDSFIMCQNENQAYKQFGNSVVVNVLQYIGIELGKILIN